MDLNLKTIQKLDSKKIYELLFANFYKLYQSFSYIGLTEEEYYNLVINEIDISKNTYKGDTSYNDYIKKRIKLLLSEKITKLLSNSESAFDIINNYVNNKFKKVNSLEEMIKQFSKLNYFLETHNYIINPDLLIDLIQDNQLFCDITSQMFKRFQYKIVSGKVDEIFNDSLLIMSIETYCMLSGIEIKEDNIIQANDIANLEMADTLHTYLREMGERPLLTAEEEKDLAIKMSQGDKEARKKFIESNLRLVVSMARRYVNCGLPILDLIQEGNVGLVSAVDRYDVSKNFRFSSYATHWIKQAMTRALACKTRSVRIPVYLYGKSLRYQYMVNSFEKEFNRFPTIEEVADLMNISMDEALKLSKLQTDAISISTAVGDEGDTELLEFIPSRDELPEDVIMHNSMRLKVRELFEKCNLNEREINILILRYGFGEQEPMTLDKIGSIYHVTRERIRQIEAIALMKIRRSGYVKNLAVYTQNPDRALDNLQEYRNRYLNSSNRFKMYLREYGAPKKVEEVQSIYEFFKEYTKKQVDEMLSKLTPEERRIIELKYNLDLTDVELSHEELDESYNLLIPKMKKLLPPHLSNH